MLGLFGETDGHITPKVVAGLAADIKAAGGVWSTHSYPGTGHAFFNDSRPEAYNKPAAEDAWTRTLAFLRANLS